MRELKTIKWQSVEIVEQRKQLLVDQVELKGENEKLKGTVTTFYDQVGDMHTKLMNLIKVGEALENKYIERICY